MPTSSRRVVPRVGPVRIKASAPSIPLRYMAPGDFTAHQAQLLFQAQAIFIFQQLIIFPLYFAPGLRGRLGGDVRPKFPCSISWMIRKGAPRLCTLIFWNAGWLLMMRAFFKDGHAASMSASDWARAAFMLQMYATGFVTVVLTPMRGPDVALGSTDALHCYAATAYVVDHFIANQWVLGVPVSSGYGGGFVVAAAMAARSCGSLPKNV